MRLLLVLSGWLVLAAVPRAAFATWSIVAVDRETGEVGAAAATCTVGVEIILGAVPGKGVIVAQAATNLSARDRGVEMISAGSSPGDVLAEIATQRFNPGRPWRASWRQQQYGVAVLGADPAAAHFTGDDTVAWSGALVRGEVSVQGNMLHGPEVVGAALRAFGTSQGREPDSGASCRDSLAEKLLRALEAGAAQGGDKRCSKRRGALTAFVAVAAPGDSADSPALYLVAPRAFGLLGAVRNILFPYSPTPETLPAVEQLRGMYQRFLRDHPAAAAGCAPEPALSPTR